MNLKDLHSIYFLGIGGIGMSALARYFHSRGVAVAGYDRTRTPLTDRLEEEGISVHYTDDPGTVPAATDLAVITPAIPADHAELLSLQQKGVAIKKRAEVLGELTRDMRCIAVAGTHGKTTTSTWIAHIFKESGHGCNAFLGGLAKNYNTNLLLDPESDYVITEADEFDRSFLTLHPTLAVITSVDADHLDIYGDHATLLDAFRQFVHNIKAGGTLLARRGLGLSHPDESTVRTYTYDVEEIADFTAVNLRLEKGRYTFDLITPYGRFENFETAVPGRLNVENGTAALAAGILSGIPEEALRAAFATYRGVMRRMEVLYENESLVYIDDYAHHPEELRACITSLAEIYPGRRICGVFQPHLYSRTRDFADDFAGALDLLDEVLLLEIYPARELPIPGIDAGLLARKIPGTKARVVAKEEVVDELLRRSSGILLTLGAGDIDQLSLPIARALENTYGTQTENRISS